jgi:hypothetical protein
VSIILLGGNLMALGTITAASATDFPATLLADGDRDPQWQADAVGAKTITLDLGVGITGTASAWAFVNSNVEGEVALETSANGADWTERDTQTIAAGTVYYAFDSVAARYWRWTLPAMSVEQEIGEVILGVPVTLPAPTYDRASVGDQGNVVVSESVGGYAWAVELGPARGRLTYGWIALPAASYAALRTFLGVIGWGRDAFLVVDHDSTARWMRWGRPGEVKARIVKLADGLYYETECELVDAL